MRYPGVNILDLIFGGLSRLTDAPMTEEDLRSYQRYVADKIVEQPLVYAAADIGLGKTAATLTGLRRLFQTEPRYRALVVAPVAVAKNTWPDEIEKWEHLQDLRYTLVRVEDDDPRVLKAGRFAYARAVANISILTRLMVKLGLTTMAAESSRGVSTAETAEKYRIQYARLMDNSQIHIINREMLPWIWEAVGGRKGWRWNILVFDEASRLKAWRKRTPGTKNTPPQLSEFGVLAAARAKFKRVIMLSGTPTPNGIKDLGGQAFILDQGHRLGATKQAFLDRWFIQSRYTYKIKPVQGARDEIMGLMKDVMFGLRAQDYIDLPPVMFNVRKVRLSPRVMDQYKAFEKTLYSEAYDVEAVSKGVLTNKLLQFANGSLYRPVEHRPGERTIVRVHESKLETLENLIEENSGQPVLVAYSFKFDLDRIRKRFPNAVVFDEEPDFVRKWNAGEIEMGLVHPASMAHGLNLQFGGHIQIWYGLTWSLELWLQFNGRLARTGQPHPVVMIHIIVAVGTADEDVMTAMQTKGAEQDDVTEVIRVRLAKAA